MSYLVTGGAGFIGSHIVEDLVNNGESVKVLDDFSTGNIENIKPFLDKIEFIHGSLCDPKKVKEAVKDVDFVLHQAAIASVPRSIDDPITTNLANINGTLSLLIACRNSNVKRVVFASSSSVYGNTPTLPKVETMQTNPQSPYALTKVVGEHYCKLFSELYGLETVSLRYFNVFGPRQNPHSQYSAVIPRFIKAIINNKQPTLYGDGKQSRDFTFVKNNVHANLLACKAKNISTQTFNIATGTRLTLLELIHKINVALDKNIEPLFIGDRKGDVKHSLADITKAKERLGYVPCVNFDEGLNRTIAEYKNGQN